MSTKLVPTTVERYRPIAELYDQYSQAFARLTTAYVQGDSAAIKKEFDECRRLEQEQQTAGALLRKHLVDKAARRTQR